MGTSTGSPWFLPFPIGTDRPDVPSDMGALARKVSDQLTALKTQVVGAGTWQNLTWVYQQIAAMKGPGWTSAMTLSALWAASPKFKSNYGREQVDPNSIGEATVRHGLGVKPSVIFAQAGIGKGADTKRNLSAMVVHGDTTTASSFQVTVWDVDSGNPWTTPVYIDFFVRD